MSMCNFLCFFLPTMDCIQQKILCQKALKNFSLDNCFAFAHPHIHVDLYIHTHMLANREKDMKRDRERESERNREPAFGTILECHSKTKQSHMETIKFLSMYAPCFQFSRNEHTATTHTRSISAFLECRQYFRCTLNAA